MCLYIQWPKHTPIGGAIVQQVGKINMQSLLSTLILITLLPPSLQKVEISKSLILVLILRNFIWV